MLETFTKSFGSRQYEHTALLRHKGRLIAFAQDADRRIHYAVLDLENPEVSSPLDHDHWPDNPDELHFPDEITEVGAGVADQLRLPVVKKGSRTAVAPGTRVEPDERDQFLSTTARFSELAPFQVLSDGRFVHVFRQAIHRDHADMITVDEAGDVGGPGEGSPIVDSTLLLDRFVLAGSKLQAKMEVRFRRSRSRTRPQNNKDSLGARDMEERIFFEPTQELRFVSSMYGGRFHVLLMPTAIPTVQRWQIFSYNADTKALDSYNVERADDGLFDTRGSRPGATMGHAESALSFDGDDARIELAQALDLGPTFTVELWIAPEAGRVAVGDAGRMIVGGDGVGTGSGELSIWLHDRGAVGFGFGDGTSWYEVLSSNVLAAGWNHLAVSFDQRYCSISVDGVERWRRNTADVRRDGTSQDEQVLFADVAPASSRIGGFGAAASAYRGGIDDIRVWDRARSVAEITGDTGRRLTGREAGLVGYWRLDEAGGTVLHDQTDNGNDGALAGDATWITSGAPIGIGSGLQRSSIRVDGRSFVSAPSALLYFHQEHRTGGYSGESKPVKHHARVMLAVATTDREKDHEIADTATKHDIAAFDIGISSDGTLAELPDVVPLAELSRPTADGLTVEDRLAQFSELDQALIDAEREIVNLTVEIAGLNRARDNIDAAIAWHQYRDDLPDVGDLGTITQRIEKLADARAALDAANRRVRALTWARGRAHVVLYEHAHFRGRQLWLRRGRWGYNVFRSHGFNDLVSSIWVPGPLRVTVFEHANEGGKSRTFVDSEPWVGRSWNDIISSVHIDEDPNFTREWNDAVGRRDEMARQVSTLIDQLRANQRVIADVVAQKEVDRQRAQIEEARLRVDREALRADLDEGVVVPMPLAHVAPNGLSVTGGLLEFAWTNDAPQLFDSATGRLGLYFRGTDDQFFVVYFTTLTQRAVLRLADERGEAAVECRVRSAAPEMDGVRIAISAGTDPANCTVTITGPENSAVPVPTETWRRVPRRPEELARVINGDARERAYIGTAARGAAPDTGRLVFDGGTRRALDQGATLLAGEARFVVTEAAGRGVEEVRVTPFGFAPTEASFPVFFVEYDYRLDASSDRVPADMTNGSLLVEASWLGSTESLRAPQDRTAGATVNSQWTAAAPGYTLAFDGTSSRATADATAGGFDADGDVTIEAWVKPGETTDADGRAQVVECRSASSQYALGLLPRSVDSAIELDGVADRILVSDADELDVDGTITIEAWVRPRAVDGIRNIVAHGYRNGPRSEVFLRINEGNYEVGSWNGTTYLASAAIPDGDRAGGAWVHLAGVYDGASWKLYRNGRLEQSTAAAVGAIPVAASWAIGARGNVDDVARLFEGSIDDVRIWKKARSQHEIDGDRMRHLSGNETALVGNWRFDGGRARDHSRYGNDGDVHGTPTATRSPIPWYVVEASVGEHSVVSTQAFASGSWTHLAAAHDQSFGVELDGRSAWIDCGNDTTLDINRDLTLEVFVRIDGGSAGLISRGQIDDGTEQDVPYCLYVDTDGKLVFAFEDTAHENREYRSSQTIVTGRVTRLAVTRSHETQTTERRNADGQVIGATVDQWDDINLYADGVRIGGGRYRGPGAGSSDDPVEVGRVRIGGSADRSLDGVLTELRIWNAARAANDLGTPINGSESGLVTWLRFSENDGNIAYDSKSMNHGRLKGATRWVPNPDPGASPLLVYRDGLAQNTVDASPPGGDAGGQFSLGTRRVGAGHGAFFQGEMEEVRVWRTVRTQEEIQDNLFRRLVGEKHELIAYYPFDTENPDRLTDHSLRGNDLDVHLGTLVLSTAPIGEDAPEVRSALAGIRTPFNGLVHGRPSIAEYGDLQYDAEGELGGVLKRCYAFVRNGQWHLVTGFKVGNLVTEWLGQVQFDPQLIGYIEGAPPVPSENLTASGTVLGELADYAGASSIELLEADSTTYTFASSRDSGFDMSVEAKIGWLIGTEAYGGIGLAVKTVEVENVVGAHLLFEHSTGWLEDATTGTGVSTSKLSRMELRGAPENADAVAYPEIGRRFVPENTGFALVQSDTADVFALRLQHNNALVSFQMRPNPDIPKDWNIITFPINPRYTKQGTLDGKVGLRPDPNYPNSMTYSPDTSYFKPIEAYALKGKLQQEEERLRTLFDQYEAGAIGRQAQIDIKTLQAESELAKLPKIEKRNLVNTYVWTADGGLFAETEETLDVQEEATGGSYSFKGMAGVYTDLTVAAGTGIKLELDALFGGHLELSVMKTAESQRTFGLDADLGGVEGDLYLRDADGVIEMDLSDPRNPRRVRTPGKVDAYRFMTFFLEPRTSHFDQFFSRVVDPIWLEQSDDPNAVALRQARQADKTPPCWRVMHRVTYVSRVLPPLDDPLSPPLERTMKELDIESNYELIRLLDPFVADKVTDFGDFATATRDALRRYHPELLVHAHSIIGFMSLYYGIDQQAALPAGGGSPIDEGAPLTPLVDAGPEELTTEVGTQLDLVGNPVNEWPPAEDLLVTWITVSGPGAARFSEPDALATTATFDGKGVYVIRLDIADGVNSASDQVRVTVNDEPDIDAGDDQELLPDEVASLTGVLFDDGLGDEADRDRLDVSWTKVGGPGEVTFSHPGELATTAVFSVSGSYLLRLTVSNGSFTVADDVVVAVAARVRRGLEALYVFEEGGGTAVRDVAAVGPPVPLRVLAGSHHSWNDGALVVAEPTTVESAAPITRALEAIRATGELSVEVWITCADAEQPGLARIVTCAAGPTARNFVLGQRGRQFYVALRTEETSPSGTERALAGGEVAPGALTHVVLTRDAQGATRVYVDGEVVAQRRIPGALGNWDTGLRLTLANEASTDGAVDQAWAGAYHLVALYSRALGEAEIGQNLRFGADVNLAPHVEAGPDQMINLPADATVTGTLLDDRLLDDAVSVRWTQASGPTTVAIGEATSLETTVSFSESGRYVLRLTGSEPDGLSASDETVVVVNQAPSILVGDPVTVVSPAPARLSAVVSDHGIGNPGADDRVTVQWSQVEGPAGAEIESPTELETNVLLPQPGAYAFRLDADNGHVAATPATMLVYANTPPEVRVAAPVIAPRSEPLQIEGEIVDLGMLDPDGETVTTWSASGPGEVTFRTPSARRTTATFAESGVHQLKLSVTTRSRGVELVGTSTVTVVANRPPVVDAGPDRRLQRPDAIELDGTVSDDGFPDPPGEVSVRWSKRSGPGEVTFGDPSSPFTTVEVSETGSYRLELSAVDHPDADPVRATMRLDAVSPPRVTDGLQVLYRFDAEEGSTVSDVSGVEPPVDLTATPTDGAVDALTWLQPGLRLEAPTILRAGEAQSRVLDALQSSNELTLEAWIERAADVSSERSPGRILTFSADPTRRNFTLGQTSNRRFQVRLKTTTTDANGLRRAVETSAPSGVCHVLYTRSASGDTSLYVDGVHRAGNHPRRGGTFENWESAADEPAFLLALGDEANGGRPWLGTYRLVAIYDRALRADEVVSNFIAGLG